VKGVLRIGNSGGLAPDLAVRCVRATWLYRFVWTDAWTTPGSKPTCSMMSISPSSGHWSRVVDPSIQIAGQDPRPFGNRARASTRP
jgi:hypothetical protein